MIIGKHCVDPKRIVTANYEILLHNICEFTINYAVGDKVVTLVQMGTERECKKWMSICDGLIGKYNLESAISHERLDDETDDNDVLNKKKIGFV